MDAITAIAPFAIAGSILPTWTIIVIGLLGTERPVTNALAFVGGNVLFRLALGAVFLAFATSLPDSASLRLDSGGFPPAVPLAIGVALALGGLLIWRRRPAPEGRTLIDRAERISPWVSLSAGIITVATPGAQYAYFLGGVAALTETIPAAGPRIAALAVFVLSLQWMLVVPVVIFVAFRSHADRLLGRMKAWLRHNSTKLAGGILLAAGAYLAAFGTIELLGG